MLVAGEGSLAFMFETNFIMKVTPEFADSSELVEIDDSYHKCWEGMLKHFEK